MIESTTPKNPFSDERKFIHDVASPLTTITLLIETSIDSLQGMISAGEGTQEALTSEVERLKKAQGHVQRIVVMLQERRNILIAASDALEKQGPK